MVRPIIAPPLAPPKILSLEAKKIRPNVLAQNSAVFGSDASSQSVAGRSGFGLSQLAQSANVPTLSLPEPLVNKYLEAPEMCCFLKFLEALAEVFTFSLYNSRTWNGRFDEQEIINAANFIALFSGPGLRQQIMASRSLNEVAAGFGEHIKRQNPDLTDEEVQARSMSLAANVVATYQNTRLTDGVLRRLNSLAYADNLPQIAPELNARLVSREPGALSFWSDLQRLDQHPNIDRIHANKEFLLEFCSGDVTKTHAPDREALMRLIDLPSFLNLDHASQVEMTSAIAGQARITTSNSHVAASRQRMMEAVLSGTIKLNLRETGLNAFELNAQGTVLTVAKDKLTKVFDAGSLFTDSQFKELTSDGQQTIVRSLALGVSPTDAVKLSHLKEYREGSDEDRSNIVRLAAFSLQYGRDPNFNGRWQQLLDGRLRFSFTDDVGAPAFVNKQGAFVFSARRPESALHAFIADVHFSQEFSQLDAEQQQAVAAVSKLHQTELGDLAMGTLLRQAWFTQLNPTDKSRAILLQGQLASNPSNGRFVNPSSGILPYKLRFTPLPEGTWAVASQHDPEEIFVSAFDPLFNQPLYKRWNLRPEDQGNSATVVGLIETALKETAVKPPRIEYRLSATEIAQLCAQMLRRSNPLTTELNDELTGKVYALYYFTPASGRGALASELGKTPELKMILDRVVQRAGDVPAEASNDANAAFDQVIAFAMTRATEVKPNGQTLLTDEGTHQLIGFSFRAALRLKPAEIAALEIRLDALALTRHVDSVTIARAKSAVRRAYEFVASYGSN